MTKYAKLDSEVLSAIGAQPTSFSELFSPSVRQECLVIAEAEGEIQVIATYTDSGCWSIGVCQIDEDVQIPQWETSFSTHEKGYSVVLTIQVPDDTVLVPEDE